MKVQQSNNYFAFGSHDVVITKAERGTTDNGKDYAEFTVLGENGEQDTARVWFTTEKSCNYALSILVGIASHNKDTEADKQKVRDAFKAITDTDQVDDKFLSRFTQMDAYFSVYESTDRTYTNTKGETRPSLDKNLTGYKPTPRQETAEQLVARFAKGATAVDPTEVPFA